MGVFPDKQFYRPEFSPWFGYGEFEGYRLTAQGTLLSPQKLYYLYSLFLNSIPVAGDVVECGVYRGGTATMLACLIADKCSNKRFHLFDTFTGIPVSNPEIDLLKVGSFSGTSLDAVKKKVGHESLVNYHVGIMPDTFKGMENQVFSFAHLDVDVYQSHIDCLTFLWPRLSIGGVMVFDDYGHPECLGSRKAIDEFFVGKLDRIIVLPLGQAFAIKIFG